MLYCRKSQVKSPLFFFFGTLSYLAANVNRDTDDHGRNSNASNEGDAHWGSDQGPQLPKNLLFPAPRLLPPEGAAGRTDGGKGGRVVRKSTNILLKRLERLRYLR